VQQLALEWHIEKCQSGSHCTRHEFVVLLIHVDGQMLAAELEVAADMQLTHSSADWQLCLEPADTNAGFCQA
jgi:hypothetical protein